MTACQPRSRRRGILLRVQGDSKGLSRHHTSRIGSSDNPSTNNSKGPRICWDFLPRTQCFNLFYPPICLPLPPHCLPPTTKLSIPKNPRAWTVAFSRQEQSHGGEIISMIYNIDIDHVYQHRHALHCERSILEIGLSHPSIYYTGPLPEIWQG